MINSLTVEERQILVRLARQAIESAVREMPLPAIDRKALPGSLNQPGATFVTLTEFEELRGCVGALEAYQPLVDDVREHAVAAALQDFRFPPVRPEELAHIKIEISRLTQPAEIEYDSAQDLLTHIRPHVDGVTLIDGRRRATFLPQVWEKLPNPVDFLGHLCEKMGTPPDHWRRHKLRAQTYQVEEFRE
jgi:uncharacterized protein